MSKSDKIKDARFANFETDPRFRLPSKRKSKTTIDKRFAGLLKDDEFTATAKVDRYGRKIKSDAKKKALQQLYQPEEDEEEDAEENVEIEDDDVVKRELEAAEANYDPARGGGYSSSESESESEEEEDQDGDATDNKASMQRLQDEQAEVETGEVTNRLAVVNLDWDHLKSPDLMALFSSFLPSGGKIEKVSIYPSEFGKERMQREELEGPPKEIFKPSKNRDSDDEDPDSESESDEEEDEDDDEAIKNDLIQEGDDRDFDSDALRSYQLDRLRYYYAVMIFSDKAAAQEVYESTDGTEYQSSSNFIDLRFIPDDVTFDDEPRDECDKVPEGYKPVEFITDALQHSKVKLTWDLHPEDAARKQTINKAFTGSRNDLEENDLKAYLASDSEDEDAFEDEEGGDEPKLSKREQARKDMRAALGLSEATTKVKGAPVGDMQITFTPALTESKIKKPEEEETTIEKYARKERERKESKREAARARREGLDPNAEAESSSEEEAEIVGGEGDEPGEDLGFDDPFFEGGGEEPKKKAKNAIRKEERLAKRAAREAEEAEKAEQKAQLQLLMAGENAGEADHLDHFDMNEITRAEKLKKKKYKKKGKRGDEERAGLQEDFKMDVDDDRFKAVFESHEYAIDPSNPKFKSTEAMQKLLEEGRKKRKAGGDEAREVKKVKKAKKGGDDIGGLVASLKSKSKRK
ncbi:pre-rRNA-processing protein ESF1 [Plectosphaerella cucumerina]|uniref:Pre-rRNA-processing protein ESF1 n=1 Tax=Plectosphaerella cucumerina TaxID=40658 RepID=A0A8K0WZV1_9PEZI|nr:pre-rRNA-processing protein ESF1 [Plectosphaerella cucumerina]